MKFLLAILAALALFAAPTPAATPAATPAVAALGDCATCGKHIYFGERCVSCIVAAKRAAHSHPCSVCDKPILVGERCAACAMAAAKQKLAHPCVDCGTTIHLGTRCTSCSAAHFKHEFQGALGRAKAAGAALGKDAQLRLAALLEPSEEAQKEHAKAIEKAESGWLARTSAWTAELAKDGGSKVTAAAGGLDRHASVALGAALEVAAAVENKKRDLAESAFDRVFSIPVKTELGLTSLGDLATQKLVASVPAVKGTDLVEDPAAVLTALILVDPMAFLMDFELVPDESGPLTIVDAIAKKSASDPATALACLTLVEATRKLQRGEDLTRSLRDISRALEVLAPVEQVLAPARALSASDDE